jgi:putative redox protein
LVKGNNVNPEAVKKAIQFSEEKYCSVGGMLKNTVNITSSYEVIVGN